MIKIVYLLTLTAVLIMDLTDATSQNRWVKVYHDEVDAPLEYFIESYDHGYLLSGKHGSNYTKYNWLIKTDVNGEILWEKTIGNGINSIVFLDLAQDNFGNTYLGGSTKAYDPEGDPLIMKLNSCGEKEWCKVFYTENNHDFSSCLTLTSDGSVALALNYTNPEPNVERICLTKLNEEGGVLWKQCYTSNDTCQREELSLDLLQTPDEGFLITGWCYYEDPTIPHHFIPHPYLLKVDSIGNFEWETVVFKETNLHGGWASSTVISPDQQYFYSSGSDYYYDINITTSPALMKVDLNGIVKGVYNVVSGFTYGALNYAQFINDSILAADAGWANIDDEYWSRAVLIDTLGNLMNSTIIIEDEYASFLEIAFDGKLIYGSNTYQNGQFDCFLTKLNQDLEDDTLYTFPFTYDSLCPYQIVSDTIVQDDCGLIVGIEEHGGLEAWGHGGLEVWPNPCQDMLNVECSMLNSGKGCSLTVFDICGREVLSSPFQGREGGEERWEVEFKIDVSSLPPGIYFLSVVVNENRIAGGKFVVAR